MQVKALELVYNLLRVVPRFARPDGSSVLTLGAMGTLIDDPLGFSTERAAWQDRCE